MKIKTLEKGIVYYTVEYEVIKEIPKKLLSKLKNNEIKVLEELKEGGYIVTIDRYTNNKVEYIKASNILEIV